MRHTNCTKETPCPLHRYPEAALCFCPSCRQDERSYKIWTNSQSDWDQHLKHVDRDKLIIVPSRVVSCSFPGRYSLDRAQVPVGATHLKEALDGVAVAISMWAQVYGINSVSDALKSRSPKTNEEKRNMAQLLLRTYALQTLVADNISGDPIYRKATQSRGE